MTVDHLRLARAILGSQIEAIAAVELEALGDPFGQAVEILSQVDGKVVVTGVGKSGIIGRKVAATLSSLGTPSFFLHPAEASHGDLGMLDENDAVIAISNSGESRELRDILLYAGRISVPVIAITQSSRSSLAERAKIVLSLPSVREAAPFGPAPMASTTATIAMGDVLAACIAHQKGFTPEQFGLRHPGGLLGLRLQTVGEWLASSRGPAALPLVGPDASSREVIEAVSLGLQGCAGVVDEAGVLKGMITDGDIRRALGDQGMEWTAGGVMTANPTTIDPAMRMGDVIDIFTEKRIANAFVTDRDGKPVGLIHVKDLMEQGFL